MTRKPEDERNEVRMELKYCEHCGGLWVRERGAGIVYCEKCQAKVADLPAPKRSKGRLILPVLPHTAVEQYEYEVEEEDVADSEAPDLDASGFDAWDVDGREFEAGGAA